MNEYAMKQAAAEYARGHYPHLFTTGGPTMGKGGGYINDFNTSASVGADLLKKAGIPREAIQFFFYPSASLADNEPAQAAPASR
jgi:hypothetical protein